MIINCSTTVKMKKKKKRSVSYYNKYGRGKLETRSSRRLVLSVRAAFDLTVDRLPVALLHLRAAVNSYRTVLGTDFIFIS